MNTLAVWWLSPADFSAIDATGQEVELPVWLLREYHSARGRNGRGRLWISPELNGAPDRLSCVLSWPVTAVAAYCATCAGLVVTRKEVPLLSKLPGIVTDRDLVRIYPEGVHG